MEVVSLKEGVWEGGLVSNVDRAVLHDDALEGALPSKCTDGLRRGIRGDEATIPGIEEGLEVSALMLSLDSISNLDGFDGNGDDFRVVLVPSQIETPLAPPCVEAFRSGI